MAYTANGRSEGVAMTAASPEHAQNENCSCERGSGNNYTSMHDIDNYYNIQF